MNLLEVQDLQVQQGQRTVLSGLNLQVQSGQMLGLLGPNGAGKSTLLRCLAGLLPVHSGRILFHAQPLAELSARTRAQHIGYLAQQSAAPWPIAVREAVLLGRLPYLAPWQPPTDADRALVTQALRYTDVLHLQHRPLTALSGGERARVLLARALVGQPRLLLADEPVAGLDPAHQLEVMQLLRCLAAEGMTVVVVLHDLTLAMRYCPQVALLHQGQLLACGDTKQVLSDEQLARSYGIRAERGQLGSGEPYLIPLACLNRGHAQSC